MGTRFAFDLGTSSIGWAVYGLDHAGGPSHLINAGVRLFSDGRDQKTGESLGGKRRAPKVARRRRDRTLQRRRFVESVLTEAGLLPPPGAERDAVMAADPYALRAKAPCEALDLHEVGRVIWHLNQRRGFKSNRKTDAGGDDAKETGKIAAGGSALDDLLAEGGHQTLGQFLAARQAPGHPAEREPVRVRLNGQGAQAGYDFYPQRAMLEAEFDAVWAEQARHHDVLTSALRDRLRHAVFHQRPLKPVLPGRCTFYPDRYRLARCTELAQAFIVLGQLGNLRIDAGDGERPLAADERDALATKLLAGKKLTWTRVRKLLDLGSAPRINLEEGGEKALHVDPTPGRFEGTKKWPGPFPDGWAKLPADQRAAIVEFLEPTPTPGQEPPPVPTDEEVAAYGTSALGLEEDAAAALSRVVLPEGHLNVSEHAAAAIVEQLRLPDKDGFVRTYAAAAEAADLHHSSFEDGEFFDRLPPYNRIEALQRHIGFGTNDPDDPPDTRYGKIANPTVHIALNQLRRVVNELIDRHGKPDEVVLEVARDLKQSKHQKEEVQKRIDANRKANDRRREEMARAGAIQPDQRGIRDKLLRMRLWEELARDPMDRVCPYTGERISMTMLLSDAVEVEHILPFSRTLDDSMSNKTVSLLRANRIKRNLTPTEAADRHPDVFDADAMRQRARTMPANKRWRFEPDAMERYEETEEGFATRQLHATGYLSRLSAAYLAKLFPAEDEQGRGRDHVWVVTGQLTAKLRRHWGLNLGDHNRKNRDDHRHHAVDATVIGVTDRSLLQRVARVSGREAERGADVDRLIAELPEPYEGFADEVRSRMDTLMVSHRPDHGRTDPNDPRRTSGKLHEETYYGVVRDLPDNQADLAIGNVVRRKPVADLSAREVAQVRDPAIRAELVAIAEVAGDKKALAAALADWSRRTGTRRVRVLKPEAGVVAIADKKTGEPYKHVVPAENAWVDIVETSEGDWKAHAVDVFAANTGRGEGWTSVYPEASFVRRLRKGDTVQLFDADGENRVKKVHQIKIAQRLIVLADVNEGGVLQKRHEDSNDFFRWDFAKVAKMQERRARRVRFTTAGRMKIVPNGFL